MRRLSTWLQGLSLSSGGMLTPVNTGCMLLLGAAYATMLADWFILDGLLAGLLVLDAPAVLAGQLWRLVTAALVHHDPLDFLFVLLGLFFFGRHVERELGGRAYARLLLGLAVAANLVALAAARLWAHLPLSATPYLAVHGFAGVDLALLAAFATLAPRATVYLLVLPVRAWILVVVIMSLVLVRGLLTIKGGALPGGPNPVVPWFALQFGGAACGWLAMVFRHRSWRLGRWWRHRRHRRHEQREELDATAVDRLLEKVSLHGLPSLTMRERRFLERYSQRRREQEQA